MATIEGPRCRLLAGLVISAALFWAATNNRSDSIDLMHSSAAVPHSAAIGRDPLLAPAATPHMLISTATTSYSAERMKRFPLVTSTNATPANMLNSTAMMSHPTQRIEHVPLVTSTNSTTTPANVLNSTAMMSHPTEKIEHVPHVTSVNASPAYDLNSTISPAIERFEPVSEVATVGAAQANDTDLTVVKSHPNAVEPTPSVSPRALWIAEHIHLPASFVLPILIPPVSERISNHSGFWTRPTRYIALDVFLCPHRYPGPGVCFVSGPPRTGPKDALDDGYFNEVLIAVPSLDIPPTKATGFLFEDQALLGWLAVPELVSWNISLSVELYYASIRRELVLSPTRTRDPQCGVDPSCVAVATMLAPGGRESAAWIQHWISLGAAHLYLYLHAEVGRGCRAEKAHS
jgi:hypothetical protein